jgi:hypothetical protein
MAAPIPHPGATPAQQRRQTAQNEPLAANQPQPKIRPAEGVETRRAMQDPTLAQKAQGANDRLMNDSAFQKRSRLKPALL